MGSEEAGAIEQLLDAYDSGDQATADQVVRSPLFRFMENDVSGWYMMNIVLHFVEYCCVLLFILCIFCTYFAHYFVGSYFSISFMPHLLSLLKLYVSLVFFLLSLLPPSWQRTPV